jgi:hypothetical protein
MRNILVRTTIFIILLTMTIGCGDDNSGGPNDEGSFRVEIYGDVNGTITGRAYFETVKDPLTDEEDFLLWMFSEDNSANPVNNIWIIRERGRQPGAGSYLIGNYTSGSQLFVGLFVGSEIIVRSKEGSMSVTSSSDNRFAGSFGFAGDGFISFPDSTSQISVNVDGQFDAISGSIIGPD